MGASSGGIETLIQILRDLPADLPAALFVVIHISAKSESLLPEIIGRNGNIKIGVVEDRASIEQGKIYVAPPDYHLLLGRGYIRLSRGPKENNHRPSIDVLFRTAARFYGRRVIGIVLSGSLDDGTAGLFAIKQRGGVAIVQDPNDAIFPSMPRHALMAVD